MGYKKKEINLDPEVDLEFRRIEEVSSDSGKTIVKTITVGGAGGTALGVYIHYEKIASGGEMQIVLPSPYKPNSVLLYLNGQLMRKNYFYTESNPSAGIITLSENLVANDWIYVIYLK